MLIFIVKRLLTLLPTMFIIVGFAFFMMRIAPGGPFDKERVLPPDIKKNILAAYDLDKPIISQFGIYLKRVLLDFDLGPSIKFKDFTVNELILQGFPVSLVLGSLAIVLALVGGLALGAISALFRNGWVDYLFSGLTMVGISIPNFVMAPLLSLVFGVYMLDWFPSLALPASGWGLKGEYRYVILPVIILALPQIAYIARIMRGSTVAVLQSNFVLTARSKGITNSRLIFKHVLRPAVMPVVSYLAPTAAGIITGSVVVEKIFQIPGIGRYFVDGSFNRDYPLVMGVTIFYAALVLVLNLVADLCYKWLDPKQR